MEYDDQHIDPTPIFRLSDDDLAPVVGSIAGEPVKTFHISVEHEVTGHYGYGADKIVPTFHYTTEAARTGRGTVFVKRFREPSQREAHHYEHLSALGAPIPRMYGHLTDSSGREVLFLEYLAPTPGIHPFDDFVRDAARFREFLAVSARFGTLGPKGQYAVNLRKFDHDQIARRVRDAVGVLDTIWRDAETGRLGQEAELLCRGNRQRTGELGALAESSLELIEGMDLSLAHGDFYPDSVGTRRETGETLMVDLEGVGYFPRFWDVARWLGPPIDVGVHECPREELGSFYLSEHIRHGGAEVAIERFRAIVRILAVASGFMMIPFAHRRALDGMVDWTDDLEEGRRCYRKGLHRTLSELLRVAGEGLQQAPDGTRTGDL